MKETKEQRSRTMRAVRSRDTTPEMTVRRFLHAAGLRYRLHDRRLPGSPDIVFPSLRIALFVHGCFWHQHPGCVAAERPRSRLDYWTQESDFKSACVAQAQRDGMALNAWIQARLRDGLDADICARFGVE